MDKLLFKHDLQGRMVYFPNGIRRPGFILRSEEHYQSCLSAFGNLRLATIFFAILASGIGWLLDGIFGAIIAPICVGLTWPVYAHLLNKALVAGCERSDLNLSLEEVMQLSLRNHPFMLLVLVSIMLAAAFALALLSVLFGPAEISGDAPSDLQRYGSLCFLGFGAAFSVYMVYVKRGAFRRTDEVHWVRDDRS